jgi:hypothetical protein
MVKTVRMLMANRKMVGLALGEVAWLRTGSLPGLAWTSGIPAMYLAWTWS